MQRAGYHGPEAAAAECAVLGRHIALLIAESQADSVREAVPVVLRAEWRAARAVPAQTGQPPSRPAHGVCGGVLVAKTASYTQTTVWSAWASTQKPLMALPQKPNTSRGCNPDNTVNLIRTIIST